MCFDGSFGVFRSFSGEVAVGTKSFIAFELLAASPWRCGMMSVVLVM